MIIHFETASPVLAFFIPTLIRLGNSLSKSTSTFTLAQLGLDLFLVSISTCNGLSTASAIVKRDSFTKELRDSAGEDNHASAVVVSAPGLNHGFHFNGLV